MSGFTLNYDKTTILHIGSQRESNDTLISQRAVSWTNEPVNILGVQVTTQESQVEAINYNQIFVKVKSLLSKWSNRSISLFAKIMIFNTLVVPMFIYKMSVLPRPSDALIRDVKRETIKFIWNGKRQKIKYEVLIQDKKEGGAGLIDLVAKDKSLKLTWIQILKQEYELQEIMFENNIPELRNHIWNCRLKKVDVKLFISDKFWREVFEAWFEYKEKANHIDKDEHDILWLHSDIRIKSVPILWKCAVRKGLIFVHQLIEKNSWISDEMAKELYGLDVLQFNMLKSSIPARIKTAVMRFDCTQNVMSFSDMMAKRRGLSKIVYKDFIPCPSYLKKIDGWNQDLDEPIDTDFFLNAFANIYLVTNVAKFRSFQYRLLHRAVITNKQLFRWKMLKNNLCTFCQEEVETVIHLFVMCPRVRDLWIRTEEFMHNFSDSIITFNKTTVIFNLIDKNPRSVKNLICLLLKQFIYSKRCLLQSLEFKEFKSKVYKIRSIEKFIATKNNKESKHNKKWSIIST